MLKYIFVSLTLLSANWLHGQAVDIQADRLNFATIEGRQARRLIGNVVFKQQGTTLYCDSAIQFPNEKIMEAYKNVKVLGSEGTTLTSEFMVYDSEAKIGKAKKNVVVIDNRAKLFSDNLTYNLAEDKGWYVGGGKLINEGNTLTSQYGLYYKNSGLAYFSGDVVLKGENFTLYSDTLKYNLNTKIAYFYEDTRIESKDGIVYAEDGYYDTKTEQAYLTKRSSVKSETYFITGDVLKYNKARDDGEAIGNVEMENKDDSVFIEGDRSIYSGEQGTAYVFGSVLIRQWEGLDTLYISSDSLYAFDPPDTTMPRKIILWGNVQIFREELQGVCDSLVYNYSDSILTMYGNPYLWNTGNQINGDTIFVFMDSTGIKEMEVSTSSFMINQDSLGNFNQMKGRDMFAYFMQNKIKRAKVIGNGQTLYYALEGDTVLSGINYVTSSDVTMAFNDSNKLSSITFIQEPEARFVPPHEIEESETKLKGFSWKIDQRPTLIEMLSVRKKEPPLDTSQINSPSLFFDESGPQRDTSFNESAKDTARNTPPIKTESLEKAEKTVERKSDDLMPMPNEKDLSKKERRRLRKRRRKNARK